MKYLATITNNKTQDTAWN